MDNRMNLEHPVVLCKGLAKKRGLPWTGRRSVLGQILGRRNDPWLNGTAPGLAIALSGSNTDVKINDLLPITEVTHESSACTRNCIPRDEAKRHRVIRRLAQRVAQTQSQRNGYFGGYICKRQKIGKLEARKCIDKMQKLRELHKGKSEFQQQRAVSGRMITDIEMNGTVRGAVEEFHLCTNLHARDALFAECIRSFPTVTVDAQNWLHRLEVETERVSEMQVTAMVPPARKPHVRSRSTIPYIDIYGFRALDTPFGNLSAFEFLRYWTAEALEPPSSTNRRTEWTDAGRRLLGTAALKDGTAKLSPGVHYKVLDQQIEGDDYWVFPREPQAVYAVLRHSWVIVRRRRPYVPVLQGAKVPNAATSPTDSAKYFSVFFRPWTFGIHGRSQDDGIIGSATGEADIPHISMLGLQHLQAGATNTGRLPVWSAATDSTARKKYDQKSGSPAKKDPESSMVKNVSNFAASWSLFLQTGVHSSEAAQLIQTLLTNAMPTRDTVAEDGDKADESGADDEIPELAWRPEDMRTLLQRSQAEDTGDAASTKRVRVRKKSTHKQALTIVETLWGSADACPASSSRKDSGPRHIRDAAAHVAARSQKNDDEHDCPYSMNRLPSATLYTMRSATMLTTWLAQLQLRAERPTAEQLAVLQAIVERITTEAAAEQETTRPSSSTSEPLFDMAHGQPGCGKSRLIGWIREAFEEVLGWQHGVQFVCLAFQNTMAAQIAGETIHHWSGIPVVEADGGAAARDPHKLSTKCQLLRWILIDEISMVSAQLFGQLEVAVSKVVRRKSPHRLDKDGNVRPFGGINVLLLGDMWQLKPVTGLALFASPSEARSQTAYLGCMLMWKSLRRCWEITGSQRCSNAWYNDVLRQCRDGHLTEESYWYLHGFPTGTPACYSADDSRGSCPCLHSLGSVETAREQFVRVHSLQSSVEPSDALKLYQPWVERFVSQGATSDELIASECAACCATRLARNRVLSSTRRMSSELQSKPWDTAPALYARNVPRYYALLQRARVFARINQEQLHWTIAQDIPLHRDDRELPCEQLDAKRRRWLELHDQETAHVVSQVPLAFGMPMRLTDTVDHKRQLFRGRRCRIHGWAPHPREERLDVDGEWVLTKMPQVIYLYFEDAPWTVHPELGKGVYPLTPVSRTWQVNKKTKVKVRRTGFFLVPDFASTAHMIQGQSVFAAFVDLVTRDEAEQPTDATQVAGYVMLSRARDPNKVWLLRPFPRELFTRGPPTGPHVLLRKLRGDVELEGVDAEIKCLEEHKAGTAPVMDPMKKLYRCTHCLLTGRTPFMKPAVAFGANNPAEVAHHIDRHGAWTRCLACQDVASLLRGSAAPAPSAIAPCIDPEGLICEHCKLRRPLHYYEGSTVKNRKRNKTHLCNVCKGAAFCASCAGWKPKTEFRRGADCCMGCELITCAGCGEHKK